MLLRVLLTALAVLAVGAAPPALAGSEPFPITETFEGATMGPGWSLGGVAQLTAAGGDDPPGGGWMRITPAENDTTGYVINDDAFPSSRGILAEFDYAAHGGTGADGMAFFLYDGAVARNDFHPGGYGGELGYASCPTDGVEGLSGAYVGIGFDEFGNFARGDICGRTTGLAGSLPHAVVIRGAVPDYHYLAHARPRRSLIATREQARRVSVHVTPGGILAVFMRYPDGTVQTLARDVQLPADAPETLKLGFTASTGAKNNNHEIRRTKILLPVDLQTTVNAGEIRPQRGLPRSWTATVTNASPNNVADARINATLGSPSLADASWTCTASGGATCGSPSGSGAPDTTADLPAGASVTYAVSAAESADTIDAALTLGATVDPAGPVGDSDPTNDSASATTLLEPAVDREPSIGLDGDQLVLTHPGTFRGATDEGDVRWQRCPPAGPPCANIPGATGPSYTPTADDTGSTVRAIARRANDAGAVEAASPPFPLPDTTIATAPPVTVAKASATFTFTSDVEGAAFACRIDDGPWTPCGATFELGGLADGGHRLEVRATVGHLADATPAVHSWTVDTTAPAPPVIAPAPPAHPPRPARPLVPPRVAVASGGRAVVGCAADQPILETCTVRLVHLDRDGRRKVIGRTTVRAAAGRSGVSAPVRLMPAGRRLVRRARGRLRVTVETEVTLADGRRVTAAGRTLLVAPGRVELPVIRGFAERSARIVGRTRADVRVAAALLRDSTRLTCVGHTDAYGPVERNRRLGIRRARAVCAALRRAGVGAAMTIRSAGERRPRAANSTIGGRAQNRRVELSARF